MSSSSGAGVSRIRLIADALALRKQVANWYSIGPQAKIALSRHHRFIDSRLARRIITVRRRDGTRLTCQVRECAAYYACFIRGDYDSPAIPWLSARTVVDIGANVGASTLWLMLKCAHAERALALEPNPLACARLRKNVAANEPLARVQVVEAALGDAEGNQRFESAAFSIQSHLTPEGGHLVDTISLAGVLKMAGGFIDIMKLDCEGGEYALLTCGSELKQVNSIVGEYHASEGDWPRLRQHLVAHGFTVDDDGRMLFWAVREH